MTDYPVKLPLRRLPTHPGTLVREILEEHLKLSKAEAARRMRISRPSLYAIYHQVLYWLIELAAIKRRVGV
jgi:hypothetical protein